MSLFSEIFSIKKKEPEYPLLKDYSSVVTDIHSHFIPGIDDGVATIEESMQLLRKMYDLGFRKFITTPHVMDAYPNTNEVILKGLEQVRAAIVRENIPITISAAAEYYIDGFFMKKLQEEKLLTITGNTALVEISYMNLPDKLTEVLFEMRLNGYTVLLAHPERYPFWHRNFEEYKKLKDQGILFQLNINSLSGYYGIPTMKVAERLINENLIDYIGSDMHGARHLKGLQDSLKSKHLAKLVSWGVMNQQL
jgi:tyrosine-protein phosphatase YwqE